MRIVRRDGIRYAIREMSGQMAGAEWSRGAVRFDGIDQYASSFSPVWDLAFRQLDPAEGEGGCRYVTDGRVLLYDEIYPASIALRGTVGGGQMAFVLTNDQGRSGRWEGEELEREAIAYGDPRRELDVVLPRSTRNLVAVLPLEEFRDAFEGLAGSPVDEVLSPERLFLSLDPAARGRLERSWRRMMAERPSGSASFALVEAIVDALGGVVADRPPDRRRALRLFRAAVALCEEADGVASTPGELALRLGVSLRTLQLAFRSAAGIPPGRYLRVLRLNRAHRQLCRSGPDETSVHAVAIEWGFRELGRFSGEYRRLFGELPSETLHRPWSAPREVLPGMV